jgi:hypothetical protein
VARYLILVGRGVARRHALRSTLTAMPGHIFVSYSQRDRAYVDALAHHLGARGLAVWHDQRGEAFDPVVQQAIDTANVVIIVQTSASMSSLVLAQQLQYAASRGKQLVVLLREASAAPPTLAPAHVVDVRDGRMPGDDVVLWLHQLGQWRSAAQVSTPAGSGAARPGGRRTLAWILGSAGAVLLIISFVFIVGAFLLGRTVATPPGTWQEQAAAIPGIVIYLDPSSPAYDETVLDRQHLSGVLTYPMSPPAGGPHNPRWQNCMGDVYPAEIAKEHAVHSLEHGAVWITYDPGLPPDQIDTLASKVDGVAFVMMSPFPGLGAPISLQAWGYQLKVDNADDERIDDFISTLRANATQEPGAICSGGITETATVPFDL